MIAIIDYDAGNIKSVQKAFSHIGKEVVVTGDYHDISKADGVVLPGVGSFGAARERLAQYELDKAILEVASFGVPFLGICLGLQLLFDYSEESEGVDGLGLLAGKIIRIPSNNGLKVPHIGWNDLNLTNNGRLFNGLDNPYVYFVHSYYLQAQDPQIVRATCDYGVKIDASVEKDNIFACQFHPEKSGDVGLEILKNFVKITREEL